ncbi:hypothetical protein EJ04DRAFT_569551 [Polyplosphaeria fusca]|uniref:Uncharacterized protein n=1 Tax=Polyplosphaeria fusca TaxID=682080 RepID=A0A9P4QMM8_9PLEO|nr:hypothetical protein EJ04DRAFT_569551 [Polyplosphaeria fusca]
MAMKMINLFTAILGLLILFASARVVRKPIAHSEGALLSKPNHTFNGLTSAHHTSGSITQLLSARREILFNLSTTPAGPTLIRLDDKAWDGLVCKGAVLFNAMGLDDTEAWKMFKPERPQAASDFHDFPHEFVKWSYDVRDQDAESILADMEEYQSMFHGISVSGEIEDWSVTRIWHVSDYDAASRNGPRAISQQTYQVDGKSYRSTGALYSIAMNKKDGMIMILISFSPSYMGNRLKPPVTEGFPDLQRLCDIVWGVKSGLGGGQIKYYLIQEVENDLSQEAIELVYKNAGKVPTEWPGVKITPPSDDAKALMATPSGVGAAFLLIQHKNQLGKTNKVKEIVLFHHWFEDGSQGSPCMLFKIE